MQLKKRILLTCLALFLGAETLFLINIGYPRTRNFDEFHYIPSAQQFLQLKENQNYEHPPLAKELIAVGMAIWGGPERGDRPIGWRFMATIFGSLTLVGMYLWGWAVFRKESVALWVAGISILNQLLYVQSRIAMLDTFMFAFMVFGLAAFCRAWDPMLDYRATRRWLALAGLFYGFATACKWFAVIPWFASIGLIIVVRIFQHWHVRFVDSKREQGDPENDWYHPNLWKGISAKGFLWALMVIPLIAYFSTFLPFLLIKAPGYGFFDIFTTMQYKMWDGQLRVVSPHPYTSTWLEWPLMIRPIWYAFDKDQNLKEWIRGVILLGNPLIMWSGLAAMGVCIWAWIADRSRIAFLITAIYAALYFSWAVIPRKISFYYYYYPAGMTLSLALAYVFDRWERGPGFEIKWARIVFMVAALAFFVYFFPILAAVPIPPNSFVKWMWFQRWI